MPDEMTAPPWPPLAGPGHDLAAQVAEQQVALQAMQELVNSLAIRLERLENVLSDLQTWTTGFPDGERRKILSELIKTELSGVLSDLRELRDDLERRFAGAAKGTEAALAALSDEIKHLADNLETSADLQTKVTLLTEMHKTLLVRMDQATAFDATMHDFLEQWKLQAPEAELQRAFMRRLMKQQRRAERLARQQEARAVARQQRNEEIASSSRPILMSVFALLLASAGQRVGALPALAFWVIAGAVTLVTIGSYLYPAFLAGRKPALALPRSTEARTRDSDPDDDEEGDLDVDTADDEEDGEDGEKI